MAARDEPLIASWVSVLDKYKMPCSCDVAPNDWWDAYQDFYQFGLVSEQDFNSVDTKEIFDRKKKPDQSLVSAAMGHLSILKNYSSDIPMRNNKNELMLHQEAAVPDSNLPALPSLSGMAPMRSIDFPVHDVPVLPGMEMQNMQLPGNQASTVSFHEEARLPLPGEMDNKPLGLLCHQVGENDEIEKHTSCLNCGSSMVMLFEDDDYVTPSQITGEYGIQQVHFYGSCDDCNASVRTMVSIHVGT